ncbi:HsdR family type I site-specific deoxyribonuclease, partial [Candidatus Haloredivivus sp. G17]
DQIARYQNNRGHEQDEGAEELFRFNQFSVVTSKDEARMGTYNTPQGEFKPWKDAYPTSDLELKDFFFLVLTLFFQSTTLFFSNISETLIAASCKSSSSTLLVLASNVL